MQGTSVFEIGGGFTQATVTNAQTGLVGFQVQAGKMLTSNILVGVAAGYDVVSFVKNEGLYERFAVVPGLVKAKYYQNIGGLLQAYAALGGGVFQALPHVGVDPVGGMTKADLRLGGSVTIGLNYWFLISKGIGVEFEYDVFDSGADDLFSYFALRLNYAVIGNRL